MESQPDIEVVGEASDGFRTLRECERTSPDVVILDAQLSGFEAVLAVAKVKRDRVPGSRVLILSNDDDLGTLLKAMEAGASGFLSKDSALQEVIGATRAIHRGQTLVPTHMLGPLLSALIDSKRERESALFKIVGLTQREREVLAILAEGGDNHAIAGRLVISPRTAKTHVQSVLSKLGLHSRLEAAAFVRRTGVRPEFIKATS